MRKLFTAATTTLGLVAVVGALAAGPAAAARRPHCAAIPVAGQPGVFTVVCSTARA